MKPQEIKNHLQEFINLISYDRNPYTAKKNHARAISLIAERWKKWGLNAELLTFEYEGFTGYNLFVPPQNKDKPFYLLLAHHDTVPYTPGINDNGSGMAIVDFIAYWLSHHSSNVALALVDFEEADPAQWELFEQWQDTLDVPFSWADLTFGDKELKDQWYTYLIIQRIVQLYHAGEFDIKRLLDDPIDIDYVESFFPMFLGTKQLVEHLNFDYFQNMIVLLNFEMVGFTSNDQSMPEGVPLVTPGNFLAVIGNAPAQELVSHICAFPNSPNFSVRRIPYITTDNGAKYPDIRRSDHTVFWELNLPAIVFTDTGNFRNPNYHTTNDTVVDYDFMAGLCDILIQLLFTNKQE